MYGSSSCHTNIKYNPGYISIDTIKKHYSNKTNLAHSVAGVNSHVRASPESNAYAMPFLSLDDNERVYRHCETPLKNKKQFTAVKIFAAIAAVTLLSGGAAYAINRKFLAGAGNNRLNNNDLVREKRDFISPPVEEGWVSVDFLRMDAKGHGTSFKAEARARLGLWTIQQRELSSTRSNEVNKITIQVKKTQLLKIKARIEEYIKHSITDFDETIAQKESWLKNGASDPEQILMMENRITTYKEGRAEIKKLHDDINKIVDSRKDGFKVKVRELMKVFEGFSKKYTVAMIKNNAFSFDLQNLTSLGQYLEETMTQLQKLRG
ncbi:hypothetical protein SC206_08055 [Rouxiella sp. T17]|uniref:hypothetical protein n=1 Tax=Rouxiella sp. T17 TaxID=3085684 RepID=UPI002FCC1FE1